MSDSAGPHRERDERTAEPSRPGSTAGWRRAVVPSWGTLRALLLAAAVCLVMLGGGLLVAPEFVLARLPTEDLRSLLGDEPTAVWTTGQAVGVVGVVFGVAGLVLVAVVRWTTTVGVSGAVRSAAEQAQGITSTAAGTEIDDAVDRLREAAGEGSVDAETEAARRDLRERLRSTAVTVLSRNGYTPEEAATALDDGNWTDDPRAAALFGVTPRFGVRLRDWLSTTPTTTRRVDHVLDELEAVVERETAADETAGEASDGDTVGGRRRHAADGKEEPSATATFQPPGRADDAADEGGGDDPGDGEGCATVTLDRTDGTGRHALGTVAGTLAFGVGIVAATPAVVFLGVVGVLYGAAGTITTAPAAPLRVTRRVGTDRPVPGDVVEVAVTVENAGERVLPAVTVVDGVPGALSVVEGSPATFTALRPGETVTYTYAVRSRRGRFAFEPTEVMIEGVTGTDGFAGETRLATPIECLTLLDEFPLDDRTFQRVGTVASDTGGEGVEFYATREYRHGDPTNRIDWKRLAKTGELTTVQFRERRAASVLLVVDARDEFRVAPSETDLDAVDRSVYAAERVFLRLLDRGVSVGVASWDGTGLQKVSPSDAPDQRPRVLTTLQSVAEQYATVTTPDVDAGESLRARSETLAETLRRRLPSGTQVVMLSPMLDGQLVDVARRLQAAGRGVTVVSPTPVSEATPGQRTLALERTCLLRALRETGASVVNWAPNEPVQAAVARLERRLDA